MRERLHEITRRLKMLRAVDAPVGLMLQSMIDLCELLEGEVPEPPQDVIEDGATYEVTIRVRAVAVAVDSNSVEFHLEQKNYLREVDRTVAIDREEVVEVRRV